MAGVIRFSARLIFFRLRIFPGARHTLLPKPDKFNFVAFFSEYGVRFGFVSGRAFGLVVARKFLAPVSDHFRFFFFFIVIFLPDFLAAARAFFIPALVYEYFFEPTIGIVFLLLKINGLVKTFVAVFVRVETLVIA